LKGPRPWTTVDEHAHEKASNYGFLPWCSHSLVRHWLASGSEHLCGPWLVGWMGGELPAPPIFRLTGMRPTEAGLGKATFSMPVTRWLEDGFRLYWGGVYALFADAPLAAAVWTTLPAGKMVTTSELNMSFVRPMSRKTGNMIGRAETVHAGRQVGLSRIEVTDQEGRMLAFGSTRCLISEAAAGDRQQSLTWAQAQGPFRALLRRQGAP
jgi:uncharacterized protein (TIGR00369 family)